MELSLSMWSVHKYYNEGRWSIVDFLEYTSKTKARGVELLSIFWRDKEKELPLVDKALAQYSLKVSSYAACNNFVSADPIIREEQLQEVKDAVDMARHFGTDVVRVFSGDLPNDDSITYEEGMVYVEEGLAAAARYAEQYNVVLCIENHGLFAGRSDQVLDLINKINSPSLRSTFDTGNFLLVGQNPSDAIKELKDYVKHVHIKDFLLSDTEEEGNTYKSLAGKNYLGKIPGDGEVDLDFILTELRKVNYNKWLVVEFEGAEEPSEGSRVSVDYMASLLEKVIN